MSTPVPPSGPGRPAGATPIGARSDDRRKKKGLLWGALAALALLAIALLLSQCGGNDPAGGTDAAGDAASGSRSADASESTGTTPSASESPDGAGADGAAGSAGTIDVGGQSLLDQVAQGGAAAALAGVEGQEATATGAQVLSVPADEGFWVGSSETDRVWVQLTGEAGESPYQVQEGDAVDFTGTVTAHGEGFADEVGVDDAEGAAQLTEQAAHIEVAKSEVQLSK